MKSSKKIYLRTLVVWNDQAIHIKHIRSKFKDSVKEALKFQEEFAKEFNLKLDPMDPRWQIIDGHLSIHATYCPRQ
jgi:hypothetical protein